ncbi:7,8-didemethyl-8-hydroxy-5-deazariboflavin synthase subunit CofG [Laspinema palackyanum]|uniref:7,8-didemethyl-8-hydroxy-5-deazariboflavin synthase subunit CofG n=1 Tax=Laspinema palackyanum TaxID=3231601 RepID=UPI00345D01B5|nr:7,8-didemethyl-8-hydroxy-5-deazariboflavin synthase subunit CofG [Laspinema sp. D2c]
MLTPSASRRITYSPAYTLVPTYECFNRCSYCNFRQDPGKSPWLELPEAEQILKSLMGTGIKEILILSGEVHPNSEKRPDWCDRLYELCELALGLGFLPHTNAGPLSFQEMAKLKTVNVSMGLMVEQVTPSLGETVHRHAPSKVPSLRLQQLAWAGELKIPFTTGLLLGIGETPGDRQGTLEAIGQIHQRWGHIQEVIIQPYRLGTHQSGEAPRFDLRELPAEVARARQILPEAVALQVPPNLIEEPEILLACLEAGCRDLGGIGPTDEVNPDYPHLQVDRLKRILEPAGWELVERSPVYPQYHQGLSPRLRSHLIQAGYD